MSVLNIRQDLRVSILEIESYLPDIVFENMKYDPSIGTNFVKCWVSFTQSLNPTMGDSFHRIVGIFRLELNFRLGTGEKDIITVADIIKDHYKRGKTFGSTCLQITDTPTIGVGFENGSRYIIPIQINWAANVLGY